MKAFPCAFRFAMLLLACWLIPFSSAVNNDGQTDILWRNYSTGSNDAWAMNGAAMSGIINLQAASGSGWKMVGTGDFNHDHHLDILWYHTTFGFVAIWLMKSSEFITSVNDFSLLPIVADNDWDCVALGYFDGPTDKNIDILWRHKVTGQNAIWRMQGTSYQSSSMLPTVDQSTGWQIGGTGDFNGDGHTDIFWRNYSTGQHAVWLLNGPTYWTNANPPPISQSDLNWRVVGVDHFNSGNQVDLLWRHTTSTSVSIWFMNGANFLSSTIAGSRALDWTISGTGDSMRDSDADGLPDLWERNYFGNNIALQNAGGDPDGDGLTNLQEYQGGFNPTHKDENLLVNDPAQDNGSEQNSQFESTIAVFNDRVIVAFVDSNQFPGPEPRAGGVYGLGSSSLLPDRTPRFVGYSVLHPGNTVFTDIGKPPLSTLNTPSDPTDDGDAGDPVLAVDKTSGIVYMVGTSPRNAGHKGIPLWKSTDGGVNFGNPITVRPDITNTDKPWITVDNASGTGQHDVYVTFTELSNPSKLWLAVSTDGSGANWNTLQLVQTAPANGSVQSSIPVIGANHVAYLFWLETENLSGANYLNSLKMRSVSDRGSTLGPIRQIRQLVTTDGTSGNFQLRRSNSSTDPADTFRAFPFPVPAVNPTSGKANHLYLAYADKAQDPDPNDRADVFFLRSTDGGATWDNGNFTSSPFRLSTVPTNDQWMPVLAVKPDGTKLFVAWYDRRNDPNNSLMDLYGRWADISPNGTVVFGTEFRITTVNFPPVFAGTLPANKIQGHYDPVYPPEFVNLHWWYPEWPQPGGFPPAQTTGSWAEHVGEYNGVWAEQSNVYLTWTDYRLLAVGTAFARNQSDIRFLRLAWP
jgi:hypothetical protein